MNRANVKFQGAGVSPEIINVVSNVLGKAKEIIVAEEAQPVLFFGNDKEKTVHVIGATFNDQNLSKEIFSRMAKDLCARERATFAIFLCESWALCGCNEEEFSKWKEQNPNASLSKHPDAKEVLMVMVETVHGDWSAQLEIKSRDIDIQNVEFAKTDKPAGRFANFLPIKAVNN